MPSGVHCMCGTCEGIPISSTRHLVCKLSRYCLCEVRRVGCRFSYRFSYRFWLAILLPIRLPIWVTDNVLNNVKWWVYDPFNGIMWFSIMCYVFHSACSSVGATTGEHNTVIITKHDA